MSYHLIARNAAGQMVACATLPQLEWARNYIAAFEAQGCTVTMTTV